MAAEQAQDSGFFPSIPCDNSPSSKKSLLFPFLSSCWGCFVCPSLLQRHPCVRVQPCLQGMDTGISRHTRTRTRMQVGSNTRTGYPRVAKPIGYTRRFPSTVDFIFKYKWCGRIRLRIILPNGPVSKCARGVATLHWPGVPFYAKTPLLSTS